MEQQLISKAAFAKATHLEKFQMAADALMSLTGIKKINQLYQNAAKKEGSEFIKSIFDQLNVTIKFDEKSLDRIPKSGSFITISNHPFGALDGLLLLLIIQKIRPDFKVMANYLLQHIEPIKTSFIPVNPFEDKKKFASHISGIKTSLQHLKNGNSLGLFPAGEVSSFQTNQLQIVDKQWNKTALKLIKKAEVPIVPIHFDGTNSLLFQFLGIIHPSLRTIALPSEILKKKRSTLHIKIGRVISLEDQNKWEDIDQLGRFLRAKTYSLESSIKVQHFFKHRIKSISSQTSIAKESIKASIINEIQTIQDLKVSSQAEFETYLAPAERIPMILNELGRLREITFRAVGEGSNKAVDLDEYDLYYHHLFLWDKEAFSLVGAYRIGKGDEIYTAYGKKGFYLSSLFKFKKDFSPILKKSVELGRSFIRKEYQQKRLPLFLLWQGIINFVIKYDNYQYLIGPVSISNNYTKLSKMLMVNFIRNYYFNHELSNLVTPRKKFKVKFKKVEGDKLLEKLENDVKQFDKIISDIEPDHAPIPVLIKKYLRQNAKIIGFNLDPKFNNALDGLMVLNLDDLPADSIANYQPQV